MIFYEIIEFSACWTELLILYQIYRILLQGDCRKKSRRFELCFLLIGSGIAFLCNHIMCFSCLAMLLIALYVSLTVILLYDTDYLTALVISFFYILCDRCFDFLLFTLISNLNDGYETFLMLTSHASMVRSILLMADKFLWCSLYQFLKKYLSKIRLEIDYTHDLFLLSLVVFLFFVYLANQTFQAFNYYITGIWLFFTVLFALFMFLMYFSLENRQKKMKLDFSAMKNELLEKNYQAINEIYTNNARLYHDLNNHLNVLYQLLEENGDNETAKQYIQEISKPVTQLSRIVWTGTDVIDVIINSKLQKMEELGISAKIDTEFPSNTTILPHDMCTILANLLDNAIEAAEKLPEGRHAALVIRRINRFVVIKVSNSCVGSKRASSDFPATSKEDTEHHGWGLSNVQETTQKYGGTMRCHQENGEFVVTVMLFFEWI